MKNTRRDFLKKVGLITGLSGVALRSQAIGWMWDTEAKRTKVSIFQTTDVHCQVHPHDELYWEAGRAVFRKAGGYAHLRTLFKQWKKENPNSFFVDTGDMFQGSELSVKTSGEAMLPILNTMGYDLYLPGNWEVVYGKKQMEKLMGSLQAPTICTNMFHDDGQGRPGDFVFKPYHVWQVAGIRIGFLGYTDHLVPIRQSPNYSKGIVYIKPEENLKAYVELLRQELKCDYVILLAHIGLSQQIALSNHPACQGVDIIMGGDTHERVREPIVGKYSKVVEPGAFGSFVGRLDLYVQDGKVVKEEYQLLDVHSDKISPDAAMAAVIRESEKDFQSDLQEVIGYSTLPLYRYFVIENTIDTMILQAMAWNFPDIDIVLSNGFRFCPPRVTPDHTGNIPITSAYLYDMLPVDAPAKAAKVTGAQLKQWLEKELNNVFARDAHERLGGWVVKFKGMQVKFYAFGEKGNRVQSIMLNGKPLEAERLYTVAACERDGDPDEMLCRINGVRDAWYLGKSLHQVMRDYLRANSPVTPQPEKNAIALDAPENLLTQVTGVPYTFH